MRSLPMRSPAPAALAALLLLSCQDPAGPAGADRCGTWSLRYRRSSGWGDTAVLDLDRRQVTALRLAHATRDTVARVSSTLAPEAVGPLVEVADLSGWARRHAPAPTRTDGETHRVVTVCDGRADTVDVADAPRAGIPRRLDRLLEVLQALWRDLLYPRD
jgi:hypothetical protein